jgi:hypothetical protein
MGFDTNSRFNSSGSSGGGSFFNSGSSGGGGLGLNGTEFTPKYWDSSSDPTPGSGSGSAYEWASKLPAGSDPFGLNKNKDKKQFPWGDVTRFAGDALNSYAQSKSGQGGRSDGLAVGGGGGVSQSGDLTIVYPQSPTVIPGQKSGLGGALGTLAGIGASFIPGLGPGIAAAMPAIGGSIGGAFG